MRGGARAGIEARSGLETSLAILHSDWPEGGTEGACERALPARVASAISPSRAASGLYAVIWLLAGCATDLSTTAPPGPIVVHDKCIKQEKIPILPPTAVTPGMSDNQKTAAMAVDARQGRQTAGDAIAALNDCVIQP